MNRSRCIELRGAAENNLCDLDIDIPLHSLTVVCGVSGSGKTSLAIDTLFAEGQRRYIESFSAYTRQYLARIEKPRFRSLSNLPPSLSIARGDRTRNNRSTVGTSSELMEPMRILFSLIAKPYCRSCGKEVVCNNSHGVALELSEMPAARAMLCFEFTWTSKVDLSSQLSDLQSSGFIRVILGDATLDLSAERKQFSKKISSRGVGLVVVERFQVGSSDLTQSLAPAIELAFDESNRGIVILVETERASGTCSIREVDGKRFAEYRYARDLKCEACQIAYPISEPRLYNFNSPIGACPTCTGFGEVSSIDTEKVCPDRTLTLREGAIAPWRTPSYAHELEELAALADDYGVPMDTPISKLTKKQWGVIQHGVPERRFGGLDGFFAWLERKKYKMHVRAFLARWRTYTKCPACQGARLSPEALAYRYEDFHFASWCEQSVGDLRSTIERVRNSVSSEASLDPQVFQAAVSEVDARLRYLYEVGLGYLSLSRTMHTLSGGEAQRVHLTTLLGSDLVDMLYVLDEPTVGLHPSDTARVAIAIKRLVDRGNTVVLIEHEPYLLFRADHVIEIGPGAGEHGGRICYSGTPIEWERSGTLTADYLFRRSNPKIAPRETQGQSIRMEGANGRNLRMESVSFPRGVLSAVVGISGSGKSSLVMDTLIPGVLRSLGQTEDEGLPYGTLSIPDSIEGCVAIDQSPIAKSIRSTPATFSKAMDVIRSVFGELPEARACGMTESHFSFNSPSGRCTECEGLGFTVVDMQFMADIRLPCSHCGGMRYRPEILQIRFRERTIAQVLEMSISSAYAFFRGERSVQKRLQSLLDIGLGYLPLGQSLSALSAGESMRLKLASHLQDQRNQLIVMDEPTTGLHFADIERLLSCVSVLLDHGNSIIVVEHNEQIIRAADWIVELGPGSGPDGGKVVFAGSRETYFSQADTPTIRALAEKPSVSDFLL
jgi:excinuclease ABC subunit A